MKRLSILLVPVLSLSMVLAACGTAQEPPAPGGVDEYGVPTTELQEPGALQPLPPEATEPSLTQPPAEATEPGLTEPPAEATEPSVGEAPSEATEPGLAVSPTLEMSEPPVGEAPSQESGGDAVIPPTGSVQLNRASNLMDFEVQNSLAEPLGDVDALVIDTHASQVKYAIIGMGGFLGLGQTLIPVPYAALQLQTAAEAGTANAFVLDVSAEELEQAPSIESLDVIGAQAGAASEGQAQGSEFVPFEQREQEILSYWESKTAATGGETGAQQPADQSAGDQMAEAGAAQLVLAQDLLDATFLGADAAQGMSGQPGASDAQGQGSEYEQPASPDATSAQGMGEVQEITIDYSTGQVGYLLVYLMQTALAPEQGALPADQGQATGDPGQVAGDEPAVVSPDMQAAAEELLPVPLSALSWDAEAQTLSYTGAQSLAEAPTITAEEFEAGGWEATVDAFWGAASPEDTSNQSAP
jgi:sporulation protein YlmC with PRC-barrel domain